MYPAYTQLVAKWSSPSICDARATGWYKNSQKGGSKVDILAGNSASPVNQTSQTTDAGKCCQRNNKNWLSWEPTIQMKSGAEQKFRPLNFLDEAAFDNFLMDCTFQSTNGLRRTFKSKLYVSHYKKKYTSARKDWYLHVAIFDGWFCSKKFIYFHLI